jgi:hypothetical protein
MKIFLLARLLLAIVTWKNNNLESKIRRLYYEIIHEKRERLYAD